MSDSDLHKEFNDKAKPVEPADYKMDAGHKVALADVTRAGFKQGDIILFADTDHDDRSIAEAVFSDDVLRVAVESKAKEVFLELHETSGRKLKDAANHGVNHTSAAYAYQQAEAFNLQVNLVDNMTAREKGNLHSRARQGNSSGFANRLKQDPQLAGRVSDRMPIRGKAIMFWGAMHGSRHNDLEEFLKKATGVDLDYSLKTSKANVVRIEVFADKAMYDKRMSGTAAFNRAVRKDTGDDSFRVREDPPELVYFLDTGTVHTTVNTPQWLHKEVLKLGGSMKPETKVLEPNQKVIAGNLTEENINRRPNPKTDDDPALAHKMYVEFEDAIEVVLKGNHADLVKLGDTDHDWGRIERYLADEKTLKMFAQNNVKHLYLEIPMSQQKYADQLVSGEMTRDQFIQVMKKEQSPLGFKKNLGQIADTILRADRHGIKVHFADPGIDRSVYSMTLLTVTMLEDAKKKASSQEERDRFDKMQTEVMGDFLRGRLDDKRLAKYVKATLNVKDGEKGVMFYGSAHGSQDNDFEEHMPGVRTLHVNIYCDSSNLRADQKMAREKNLRYGFNLGSDKAELVIIKREPFLCLGGQDDTYTTRDTSEALIRDLAKVAEHIEPYDGKGPVDTRPESLWLHDM